MIRAFLLMVGIATGLLLAGFAPALTGLLRAPIAALPGFAWVNAEPSQDPNPERAGRHEREGQIELDDQQIAAAGIELGKAGPAVLIRYRLVPGTIVPDGDRIARVAVRLLGTVSELRKRIGDQVEKNEVVAVIESREVADAKSEYLATRLADELQQTLFARATSLWQSKVMTENDYLRARAAAQDARVKFDTARQKLFTLGLTEEQIADLPNQPPASLRRQEVRSPVSGRIAERRVDVGSLVGREGQESELYVVVDLSRLWVEIAVTPGDLAAIREGQDVTLVLATNERVPAQIIFVSPLLDRDTRAARVVASLENPDQKWRPGTFVTVEIPLWRKEAKIAVPKSALQNIGGDPVVFVRTERGFEVRKVTTGLENSRSVEIVSGLSDGTAIAVRNSFILKAELGKGDAEHGH
jgi:membrane fusion protein, heavy metal efflux system